LWPPFDDDGALLAPANRSYKLHFASEGRQPVGASPARDCYTLPLAASRHGAGCDSGSTLVVLMIAHVLFDEKVEPAEKQTDQCHRCQACKNNRIHIHKNTHRDEEIPVSGYSLTVFMVLTQIRVWR
jgi:hypothetical protein